MEVVADTQRIDLSHFILSPGRRDDDDRGVRAAGMLAKLPENGGAVNSWQVQVQEEDIREMAPTPVPPFGLEK